MIPEEILEATLVENRRQFPDLIPSMINERYNFSFSRSEEKYGKTEEDRVVFWWEVLVKREYQVFFNKFPKQTEYVVDGQKFIL